MRQIPDTRIADARFARQVAAVLAKHDGRSLNLWTTNGSAWRADILPRYGSVMNKMRADDVLIGGTIGDVSALIEFYTEQPIASGTGATIANALANLKPVKWTRK